MYAKGLGIGRDDAKAAAWYRKAAEQSFAKAQNNLGLLYGSGQGVLKDDAKAAKWFREAAEQGYAAAQNNLGYMYDNGKGVSQNNVQAYLWFSLAASRGYKQAHEYRDDIANKMTLAQIAEAQKLAREWWAAFKKGE